MYLTKLSMQLKWPPIAIEVTYSETWYALLIAKQKLFGYFLGLRQGDKLTPFLFTVALDYAIRSAMDGREEELGFTLQKRTSQTVAKKIIIDLDFADDITLHYDTVEKACNLLRAVEEEYNDIWLGINAKKTNSKPININDDGVIVKTCDGTQVEVIDDYNYLGAWVVSTKRDAGIRRAKAWKTLHNLKKVWKSNLANQMKRQFFVATVESVKPYGSEVWNLTVQQECSIDGLYTWMLLLALNMSWERRPLRHFPGSQKKSKLDVCTVLRTLCSPFGARGKCNGLIL